MAYISSRHCEGRAAARLAGAVAGAGAAAAGGLRAVVGSGATRTWRAAAATAATWSSPRPTAAGGGQSPTAARRIRAEGTTSPRSTSTPSEGGRAGRGGALCILHFQGFGSMGSCGAVLFMGAVYVTSVDCGLLRQKTRAPVISNLPSQRKAPLPRETRPFYTRAGGYEELSQSTAHLRGTATAVLAPRPRESLLRDLDPLPHSRQLRLQLTSCRGHVRRWRRRRIKPCACACACACARTRGRTSALCAPSLLGGAVARARTARAATSSAVTS